MKKQFYLLTAVGADRPGLVARVTGVLFFHGCNLEDSAMMRLGAEFGMFAIFTSPISLPLQTISKDKAFRGLFIDLKSISSTKASFIKSKKSLWIVRVHGADQPGLVHHVTHCLADHGFNITDLSTHRTSAGKVPGYVLFIEGELAKAPINRLTRALAELALRLDTHISLAPVATATF